MPSRSAAGAVLTAGIAVLDHVFRLERFPQPGTKTRASDFAAVTGGCAANAAIAVARLGGDARLAAPLGDDAIGDAIVAGLEREGVDCGGLFRVAGASSPLSAICIDAAGERMIVNHRDERLSQAHVPDPAALVDGVAAVLLDDLFPDVVLPIARAARARRIPVVLDIERASRAREELRALCSHLVFSAQGLREVTGRDDLAAGLDDLGRSSDAFLAVTDGERDMLYDDSGTVRRLPAFAVAAVDTLAAGDVFHGAFALALAERRPEAEAMRFAAAVAAIKCTRFGGIAGAPGRSEVEQFLASGR